MPSYKGTPAPVSPREPATRVYERPTHLIVRLGDQLVIFTDLGDTEPQPQCVARTKKGRCRRPVGANCDYNGWSEWSVAPGKSVEAMEIVLPVEAYIQQRCETHLNADASDAVAPTWQKFDPEQHARFVRRHSIPSWSPEGLGRDRRADHLARERDIEDDGLSALLAEAEKNRVDPPALTALYRYYDDQDRLLYIGITDNLFARTASHAESSTWMDFAARSTIERYPTRKEAEKVEREAIKAEQPLFNAQHNSTPEAQKRLVEYLIEHGRTDLLVAAVSRG